MERVPSQLRRSLFICTVDGMCYTAMLGLGQEYFAKLAQLLGLGDAAVGLLETLPMLLAVLTQQLAVHAVARAGAYRPIVWISAALQALMLFPLAALAAWASLRDGAASPSLVQLIVFALVSAYYIGAFSGGPAWMALMGLVIPDRVMPRYLGRRTVIIHLVLLVALLCGGVALHLAARGGPAIVLRVLAGMFALAGVARLGSAYFLSRYAEPPSPPFALVGIREVVRRVRTGADGRALTFLVAAQAAFGVGFPFFRPFILNQIGREQADNSLLYSALLGAFWIGKMVAPEFAGRAVHRFGLRRTMWASAVALSPMPLLWLISGENPALISAQFIVQFLSGAALASFELCSMLMQMEHIPVKERASVLATFNLAMYSAGLAGSLLGGALLGNTAGFSDYALVFAASCALRFGVLGLLARIGRVETDVQGLNPVQDPGGECLNISVVRKPSSARD